ncbi:uncharacterized protein LOC128223594 [Mya arenaria]|uniref:uncharacterized protein LOC128223594 n=1 Tax=Mya arenaria TaxID=6604 RepID=UPI0022E507FA|nr:uncharacterized protein LOC128223594 [Mya arenaria]
MCSWKNHYCWPGNCSKDGLTRDCTCATGFRNISHSEETSCQPTKKPSILTCDTVAIGPNGEKKRSISSTNSTECLYLQDMYGNYQPSTMQLVLSTEYTIDISSSLPPPSFIVEQNFGITDTTIYIKRQNLLDSLSSLSTHRRLVDDNSSQSVKNTFYDSHNISVSSTKYVLTNGQALCLEYETKGGGYLKAKDTRNNIDLSAKPYAKTSEQRTVCYRYDNQPPEHCSKLSTCSSEPLKLDKRITRSNLHHVQFDGWLDPVPLGGATHTASSIESYEIRVNEVLLSVDTLKVDYTTNVLSTNVNHTVTIMDLNLTSDTPRLYCLTLEVKDVADNVRQSRRFILYDNTSTIAIWTEKPFRFTSASPATDYTWQTHHNKVCLSWKDHFYNDFYIHNELLNAIEPDPHGLITGLYEQITGEIPVSGTSNVYGIIAYNVSWSPNHGSFSVENPVPTFTNQSFCKDLNVKDGDTYTLNVKAIDIVGNTLSDNQTVFIDRSAPHLNNIWLKKDGYEMLFVHNSTDLSKMKMTFNALDPHSGLSKIHWTLGIADTMAELLDERLAVRTIKSCSAAECYCPDIGICAFFNYTIPLNRLNVNDMHIGNHNRNYFFTIKVTNMAGLSTSERIDVLVDDSPPSAGVVYEGPEDSPDIDYTSDDSILVHWHGFIDHESGIKLYRVGLSDRCLSTQDLYNFTEVPSISTFRELPFSEETVRIPTTFTGKRFVTVIALNNAMEPSKPACSDGITRDLSPPEFRNMTLQHGRLSESLLCLHGVVYLMKTNMQRTKLHNTSDCRGICAADIQSHKVTEMYQIHATKGKDEHISSFLCKHLPLYANDTIIYLPNDNIYITWIIEEGGSQIQDFFVGLGFNPTEIESPSIVAYTSTQKKTYFRRRHEGIGSDEIFYIFIKVINKAGLERIATIGPVLIDQTPPLNKTLPQVLSESEHIVFGWDISTFYDEEQSAQIDQIFFQFDPSVNMSIMDVDAHFTKGVLCARWKGFLHHENLTLEVGVGLSNASDDVVEDCVKLPVHGHISSYACIKAYSVGGQMISNSPNRDDIASFHTSGRETAITLSITGITDGTSIYFTVNGSDHFGLSSVVVSAELVVDTSPPTQGIIHFNQQHAYYSSDTISIRLVGFRDDHSGISYFNVGIGSSGITVDTFSMTKYYSDTFNIDLHDSNILEGHEYFILVQIDLDYQSDIYTIHANWKDFSDKESDIDYFNVGLRTDHYATDVQSFTNVGLKHDISWNGSFIPGQRYYTTVESCNKAGLCTQRSSDGMILDNSPPIMGRVQAGSCVHHSRYLPLNTSLRLQWAGFEDPQSDIDHFEVCLGRQKNMCDIVPLFNALLRSNMIKSDLSLPINTFIFATVWAFNGVGMNVSSASDAILVDITAPYNKIKPSIKHDYNTIKDKTAQWEKSIIRVFWEFVDDESPILNHEISLFTHHGGHTPVERVHLGSEKHYTINLDGSNWLHNGDIYVLVVTSCNAAGLCSTERTNDILIDSTPPHQGGLKPEMLWQNYRDASGLHSNVSLTCVPSSVIIEKQRGILELEKHSCDVQFCNKDCTCAVVGKPCIEAETNMSCVEIDSFNTTDSDVARFAVFGGLQFQPLTITASSACLAGHWAQVEHSRNVTGIHRFEWSIGIHKQPHGEGIFDLRNEIPWVDIGLRQEFVHCLPINRSLVHGELYDIYVKTWYGPSEFAIFTSKSIKVDQTPPNVRKGRYIIEGIDNCATDIDFIFWTNEISACWSGVFSEQQSYIQHYLVALGTSPNVDDVFASENIGLNTNISIGNLTLEHAVKYYFTVTAVNTAGLHTSLSSDGFIVDTTSPSDGVVFNTITHKNVAYQSSVTSLGLSWHGFQDHCSGIKSYYVALVEDQKPPDSNTNFTHIGLKTSVMFDDLDLIPGSVYYGVVKAIDAAGHESDLIVSPGVIIDSTPPKGYDCDQFEHMVVLEWLAKALHVRQIRFDSVAVTAMILDKESHLKKVQVGAGTTPGGFQIQPLTANHADVMSVIIKGHLVHAMKVYTTVIAENHAGLRSVFQSTEPIIIDHTSPIITDLEALATECFRIQKMYKTNGMQILCHRVSRTSCSFNTAIEYWTNVHLKTVATARGLTLHNTETLNAHVRATNSGQHRGEAVHASLITISQPPALSGTPMLISQKGNIIHIDWEQAFDTLPEIPVVYSLVVGSKDGFTDILDLSYYTGHTYDVVAPSYTIISPKISELFFTITCSYPTDKVSFERTEQENDIGHSSDGNLSKGSVENPYESFSDKTEGKRISSLDETLYMNLQLNSP